MAATTSYFNHGGEDGDHSVIKKIVQQHGPATGHKHFPNEEIHNVVTHHADGHTHVSEGHPSFSHAHEHIGIAHGMAG
jgi:hypothetical protein